MKTSIVMATFNGEAYIREQMKSLLRQSVLPDELIVADDSSSDATVPILKSMAQDAPFPVKFICRQATLGYAYNFADAALQASGDIIFFCDQDDYWEAEKIEVVTHWFGVNPTKSLAIHNISICDEKLGVRIANYFEHLDRNYARHQFIKGCATAVRSDLVKRAFPLPRKSNWHHDNRVHAIARIGESDGYIQETLIKHRIHASQTSGYITNHKGLTGLLLAKLEQLGMDSSPTWLKSINLARFLGNDSEILELLVASGKTELAPFLNAAISKIQKKK